jgi:hypothetical protein
MNYLSIIFKEHQKQNYCLGSGWGIGVCTTCGCSPIRERLFTCIVDDANIILDKKAIKNHSKIISRLENPELQNKMIENLCENLNSLTSIETKRMGMMPESSTAVKYVRSSMLVFIILEIWNSIISMNHAIQRDNALQFFLEKITNEVAYELILSMDKHHRSYH